MKKSTHKPNCQIVLFLIVSVISFSNISAQESLQKKDRDIPTYFYGTLSDCYTGEPLNNIRVSAMTTDTLFTTETNSAGYYKMRVQADTFDVVFTKPGLHPDTVFGKIAPRGVRTEISRSMCKIPYPPGWVFLNPNEADTEAVISWTWPCPDYEIIYDDGTAEDYALWIQAGGRSAVRFTPAGYPATVKGGRIYVGDGSFPEGSDFIGTDFAVGILDDDGPDGMPGTVLDSVVVTVNNYEWVVFDDIFNRTFEEGDFYLVMWQLGLPPEAAPLGIDTDVPTVYRSYVAMAGTDWIVSPYQDFMMRATVSSPGSSLKADLSPGRFIVPPRPPLPVYIATGPPESTAGTVKNGTFKPLANKTRNREIVSYELAWVDSFIPDSSERPADGTLHPFPGNETSPFYDSNWGTRPPGFYAYAVRTNYENDTSPWTYSNVAAHLLDNTVEITAGLCDDSLAENIEVLLVGKNYPYQLLEGIATLDTALNRAVMVFDSVINGLYDLTVYKIGYHGYFHFDLEIDDDYIEFVTLQENTFPANNLYVDSLTSVATWEPAWITQLALEDFEGEQFPPEGWQKKKGMGEIGWYRASSANFGFTVPPGDGYYAVVNSYMIGSGPYETDNYLIMPEMDLRQSPDYKLYFDHFFNGGYGETAQIKYSTDTGNTWETYFEITPVSNWSWNRVEVDLSPISGPEGLRKVWLALYYSDNRNWAQGWTVDNVTVHNGPAPVLGYYVYLNDSLVAETPPDVTTYTYTDIIYGRQYKATVRANYNCGLSDPVDYYWTSGLLFLPRGFGNNYTTESDEVPLYWLPPLNQEGFIPEGLLRFNVYRDGQWVSEVDYNGEGSEDTIRFTVDGLDPDCYALGLTAVYDLEVFGFPGQEGETIPVPDSACVYWGFRLPFAEDWNEGGFAFNGWRLDNKGWTVNSSQGFPEPSATFNSDEMIGKNDYSSSLVSNPFMGNELTEGDIFVDFNLRLDDVSPTGDEQLLLEISTDAGKTWDSIAGFDNAGGSFGFEDGFNHLNITLPAKGSIFHLRFRAKGKNADNIQSWFVDNIHIYRLCDPPKDLEGTYFWEAGNWGVRVDWRIPEVIDSAVQWIFWDDESYTGGFGFGSNTNWAVAQRWDAGQLKDWNGVDLSSFKITKISLILNDSAFGSVYVKIWSGQNAGTLLYQQKVENPVIGQWMGVHLEEAVAFDIDSELWVGYAVYGQPYGIKPAAYDQGPAVSGYGDLFYTQGKWWLSEQLGLDNNWAIHTFLEKLPDTSAIPASVTEISAGRDFGVFKLYRQQIGVDDDYVLYDLIPLQQGQLAYSYFDYAPAVSSGNTYNYKLTANWQSDIDECESEPALSVSGTEDYVTILVTDLQEPETTPFILYPNPARERVTIRSAGQINRVTVFNIYGQRVMDKSLMNENTVELNLATLEAGIYLVRVKTANAFLFKRLIISN
ncbi:MAG: T9SS type A sorting domain-containing protein [Bacteroidales bacterium]|nr:T9SS type A sorting domain-containing protein [Bacteroidales bacterium]